jgi:hypothetical protein
VITKYQNILAWALGIGIVSFAFRDYYYQGIMIGLVLCVATLFIMLVIIMNDRTRPKNVLGSKWVWIPLLVVSLSIIASGLFRYLVDKNTVTLLDRTTIAVVFFGTYLACRMLGEKVFKPFSIAVIIESVSVVVYSLFIHYGIHNGGLASVKDYNVAIALMLFGAIVSIGKKQWLIVLIALVGIFFAGAEEGIFALIIVFITILIRRDFSVKLWLSVVAIIIIVALGMTPFNYTRSLYALPIDKVTELITHKHNTNSIIFSDNPSNNTTVFDPNHFNSTSDYLVNGRIDLMKKAFENWNWLGSGYVMNPVDSVDNAIYNVPLVIAEQVGILGTLAWVVVLMFCLVKTKWKYAFIAVIALMLLDNFMWCQCGLWFFTLVGVATISERKTDLIYAQNIQAV